MADKIPKEQERIKNFRKAHGATKVGEVTVDMVSFECQGQSLIKCIARDIALFFIVFRRYNWRSAGDDLIKRNN